jgi:ankyrin repeat protein
MLAAGYGNVEVVRALLEGGADVHWGNSHMQNALHFAAGNGRLEVCRMLLDSGAEVNAVDRWKDTALHQAAWGDCFGVGYRYLYVLQLLVERGADVRLKNDHGRTAADIARYYGQSSLADWLDSVSRV